MFLDESGIELSNQNLSQFIDQAYRVQTFNNELIISGLSEEHQITRYLKCL